VGGIADYSALLARHLRDQGMRISVLTSRRDTAANAPEVETVSSWGFASLGALSHQIGELRPDVVHLQYQTAAFNMSAALSLLPYALRTSRGRPRFVTTFHDLRGPYLFPKAGALRRVPARVLLGGSDGSVFTSQDDLAAAQPRGRAAWIPLGPGVVPGARSSRRDERDRRHIDAGTFVIAYFGFMNSSKGLETLLAAAGRLAGTKLDFKLVFVGADRGVSDPTNAATAAETRFLASQLGLDGRIVETGWLPARDLSRALTAADVAALPFTDGASLRRSSLVTCFAHGLPVVTTTPAREGQLHSRHLVEPFNHPEKFRLDDEVAALVPPGDPEALADELARLADDVAWRKALGRSGRRLADRLAWPGIATATANFYHSVADAAA
jgi:glycosyltransferase involved in cell wall biosynthesis